MKKWIKLCSLVDFDVDSSLEIEVTLTDTHQFVVPDEKYPRISENMTEGDFQSWKNSYLQEYLADRSINKTGNNDMLVKNAYGAYSKLQRDRPFKGTFSGYYPATLLKNDVFSCESRNAFQNIYQEHVWSVTSKKTLKF